MPQTFYVTQDEEILSLVGRLRSSALLENVFVVPKRALILQSVVNLRILSREAEKMGKAVVIVTQDSEGRMLAEKAGIATRAYSEETRIPDRQPNIQNDGCIPSHPMSAPVSPHRVDIGSDEFFGANGGVPTRVEPAQGKPIPESAPTGELKLRIRDNTPKHLPSLNSATVRSSDQPRQSSAYPNENPGESIRRHALEQPASERLPQESTRPQAPGKLAHVFRNREAAVPARIPKSAVPSDEGNVGSRARLWFLLFIGISTLSLLGTGAFLFLPKAEIVVIPNSSSQSVEMEFEGTRGDAVSDKEVPIRLIEKEMEVTVSVETSGNSSGNGEKARGEITISNEFDEEPQPLVATTRFESSDGKIFRLVRGVTVPGMSEVDGKKEPGVIETEIVADSAGEDYNIEPTTFTIPGFKGSPKYAKFSAKSKKKTVGGSVQGESKNHAVSSSDISRAKEESRKKFQAAFEEAVKAEVSGDDRFFISSADVELIGTPSHPQVGVAASSFEYVSKWTGKIFVFSEKELREKATGILRERSGADTGSEARDISFEYGDATADYEKGLLYVRARVIALFVATIDKESLRDEFVGKGAEEIKAALEKHPEIKKIEINLKPKFFSFSVPKDRNRVTIRVETP